MTTVRVATTTNGTLSSSFKATDTIDGVVLSEGDYILIKDQLTQIENGVYVVQISGSPQRLSSFRIGQKISGELIYTIEGTLNGFTEWTCTNLGGSDTVGTDNLIFINTSVTEPVDETSAQTLTNKIIIDPSNNITADSLRTTTTSVNVSNSLAPIAGQLLIATSGTSASWSALPQGRAIKDEQIVTATSSITQDLTTFSDIDGMTLTTSSSANLDYTIIFNAEMTTSTSNTLVEMDITIDGVPIITKSSGSISKSLLVMIIGYAANVPSGSVVNVRSRIISTSGTSTFDRRTLFISGL